MGDRQDDGQLELPLSFREQDMRGACKVDPELSFLSHSLPSLWPAAQRLLPARLCAQVARTLRGREPPGPLCLPCACRSGSSPRAASCRYGFLLALSVKSRGGPHCPHGSQSWLQGRRASPCSRKKPKSPYGGTGLGGALLTLGTNPSSSLSNSSTSCGAPQHPHTRMLETPL